MTAVLPRIHPGFPKATNPQFNVLDWLPDVPVGSTLIASIHEKVESEGDAPTVTFCHGTARIKPWSASLEVMASLASALGSWIDLPPQTKIENDRGPVLNVTCKIMEVEESRGQGVLSGQAWQGCGGQGVEVEESRGQGVPGQAWQATHMPSAPPHVEEPPVKEVPINSDDDFQSRPVGQAEAAEATSCRFYIPRAVMGQSLPNLWPDQVKDPRMPAGLALAPLANYHAMAIGWDWTTMEYHPSALVYDEGQNVIPEGVIPKD